MKTETLISLQSVKSGGIYYPAGAEIGLDDLAEIERLIKLGAICTLAEYERRTESRTSRSRPASTPFPGTVA